MKKYIKLFVLIIVSMASKSYATTWDEPWTNQVIKEATSFVLAKVVSSDPENGVKVNILKTLGGSRLTDTLLISNFYLLDLCSSSDGHGAEFHMAPADSCYFFLKKNNKGEYCIATPTSGFSYVANNKVKATYRHSYHQASVSVSVYEITMMAIYNHYHGLPFDTGAIRTFVVDQLQMKPAGFDNDEISSFFLQHVALECVYHLKLSIEEKQIMPFLNDQSNFHNQVSGARAMSAFRTETSKEALFKVIADTSRRTFVRVVGVWSLGDLNPKNMKAQLQQLIPSTSEETDGFGGDIMDPRVCTRMPSLKKALTELTAIM
jgi:hypothetical protein